ncbi:MAG: hypothetical protein ACXAC7_14710 [Candidatus Hodarchaeales archaeon]|jgi:hypothetical protein
MSPNEVISLQQMVQALIFEIEEELVEVEMLDDQKSFEYLGIRLNNLKKSSIVKLPLYIALFLAQNGQAKLIQIDINAILYNELRKQQSARKLQEIPVNILGQSLSILSGQQKANDTSPKWFDASTLKKSRANFQNLVNERLKKILREIKVVDYRKIDQNLDSIERPIIQAINEILEEYSKAFNNRLQEKM